MNKKMFWLAFVAMLFAAVALFVFLDNPKAEVRAVRKCFEEMSKVKLTYISDLEKQASQVITASIDVEGKGEMGFTRLSPGSFTRSSHVYLHGIRPYSFRTREIVKGQESYGYAIDIGRSSPVPAARQLAITNVQSAVSHYDELLALVTHWPGTTNEWPNKSEEIHFTNSDGEDYFFSLKRSDTEVPK
jgi:hypothetical protein